MSKSLIELAEVTTLDGNDEILVNDSGNPRRISVSNLFANTVIDGNEGVVVRSSVDQSQANNANEINNIVTISQSDYDAIANTDSETLYFII